MKQVLQVNKDFGMLHKVLGEKKGPQVGTREIRFDTTLLELPTEQMGMLADSDIILETMECLQQESD